MVLQWLLTCIKIQHLGLVWFMVFNVTFNNISVILWWSVLLMEKITDLPQFTDKLYHIMLYPVRLARAGFKLTTLVVIATDCTGTNVVVNPTTIWSWPYVFYLTHIISSPDPKGHVSYSHHLASVVVVRRPSVVRRTS